MSQQAYVRFVPELKDGGILIVEQDLVRVSDLSVFSNKEIQVYSVPATRIAEVLGKRMVLNSVMVGFFTAVSHLLDPDAVGKWECIARSGCPSQVQVIIITAKPTEKGHT